VVERPELWIVDKPAGMPVEPTRLGKHGTLHAWLTDRFGAAFVTHRLDTATSGLIAVARTRDAQAQLNAQFAAHAVTRRYLAIVAPPPTLDELRIDVPLDGRAAVTHAIVAARAPAAAAVLVRLETGRTRQIRRHFAGAGFPVVGETLSGARTAQRLLLHAFELKLPWAAAPGGTIDATAAPPEEFVSAAAALGLPADVLTRDGSSPR
jgi:23S rRNA pseudouridine1911/1915/1917 synthase